jgi:hypothetical protein
MNLSCGVPNEPPIVAQGRCFPLFAFEVAQAIDLDAAERRLLSGAERQTIKHKRRAPASFEYRPAPLRVNRDGVAHALGEHRTTQGVDVVLYDFGAVSVSYEISIAGPLTALPALAEELWGNERLLADSRRQVEELLSVLGDAALRPHIADFVEDYSIFHIEAFTAPCEAAALWTDYGQTVSQILRAARNPLSQQEVADATALRLSFGPTDATIIDTDAAILFDAEGEDVRDVIEFANTQVLEMRFLDQQLDNALERAYDTQLGRSTHLWGAGHLGPDLRRLARMQLDSAILFEQVTNALKLVGDQFLARVYSLTSRRFHLAEWDASISRKLQTLDGIYAKMTDQAATRRMEVLEWIIIILFVLSLLLSVATLAPH